MIRGKHITDAQRAQCIDLINRGVYAAAVAQRTGVSAQTVRKIAKEVRLPLKRAVMGEVFMQARKPKPRPDRKMQLVETNWAGVKANLRWGGGLGI